MPAPALADEGLLELLQQLALLLLELLQGLGVGRALPPSLLVRVLSGDRELFLVGGVLRRRDLARVLKLVPGGHVVLLLVVDLGDEVLHLNPVQLLDGAPEIAELRDEQEVLLLVFPAARVRLALVRAAQKELAELVERLDRQKVPQLRELIVSQVEGFQALVLVVSGYLLEPLDVRNPVMREDEFLQPVEAVESLHDLNLVAGQVQRYELGEVGETLHSFDSAGGDVEFLQVDETFQALG